MLVYMVNFIFLTSNLLAIFFSLVTSKLQFTTYILREGTTIQWHCYIEITIYIKIYSLFLPAKRAAFFRKLKIYWTIYMFRFYSMF